MADRVPRRNGLPPALRQQIQELLDRLAEEHGLDLPTIDELLADGSLQIKISSDPSAAAEELGIDPDLLDLQPGQIGGKIEQQPGMFKASFVGHIDDLGAAAEDFDLPPAGPVPDTAAGLGEPLSRYRRCRPSRN